MAEVQEFFWKELFGFFMEYKVERGRVFGHEGKERPCPSYRRRDRVGWGGVSLQRPPEWVPHPASSDSGSSGRDRECSPSQVAHL